MSDTHGQGTDKIREIIELNKFDLTVHCGDYLIEKHIMNDLFDYYVDGNNDSRHDSKISKTFIFDDFKFVLLHGHVLKGINPHFIWTKNLFALAKKEGADVVLFGHSHHYEVKYDHKYRVIANPGSLTFPRSGKGSYMIIEIKNRELNFVKKMID